MAAAKSTAADVEPLGVRTGKMGRMTPDTVGTMTPVDSMRAEKRAVAQNSVFAAAAITALKIVVGISTGSLGILSEAAHSLLDLIAAVITLLSVRVSDKPADADHQYGHGK